MKKLLVLLLIPFLFLMIIPTYVLGGNDNKKATIFYSQFCSGCFEYLENELKPELEKFDIKVEIKDYIQDKKSQQELAEKIKELKIPPNLIGHMMTFVQDEKIFAGHVPITIIDEVLREDIAERIGKILVFQDLMHGEAKEYKAWAGGEIKTYPIDESISIFLNQAARVPAEETKTVWLLPLVVSTALLDSLNPCAFAVLLFFIAFLFTIGRARRAILGMGISFVFAIFSAYLLIGLGLLSAIIVFGSPHFMAKVGAGLVIFLGLVNLQSFLFPKSPLRLAVPEVSKETIKNLATRATIPAAFVLGFLVGLCTFPCSGGPYVAILTLLSTQATFWSGLGLLLVYNLFFILPLVIILFLASNKVVTEKITSWQQEKARMAKLISSLVMIGLGLIILIFFV